MAKLRDATVHGGYTSAVIAAAIVLVAQGAAGQRHDPGHRPRTAAVAGASNHRALASQVALDRSGFSPGEIDGRPGVKTAQALAAFESAFKSPPDFSADPLTTYTITAQDAAGPFIGTIPRDMMDQAALPSLGYASLIELLAERFHSSPDLLKRLNSGAAWNAGESIKVPNVEPFMLHQPGQPQAPKSSAPTVEVLVTGTTKSLVVRDSAGKTLMYAPVTTGSEHDPLPIGEWKVLGVSWNPVFNYNPDLFWDASPEHTKAKIAAGPNNPVGVVWIDINKDHFGLHGTPEPATIGRTESHGCIRLTNWDAARLARLVSVGTKVIFQP